MRIIAIHDNEGKTFDRYTVVTDQTELNADSRDYMHCLSLSENPTDPQGMSQWGMCDYTYGGEHMGKAIHFEQLNAKLQQHIADRIFFPTD